MSFIKYTQEQNTCKFVVPFPGKMFFSNLNKTDKALCFCLNKGYFEYTQLPELLIVLDEIEELDYVVKVGAIDKILLKTGKIIYRQRVFIKNLLKFISLCKFRTITFEIPKDFRVTINSCMNCLDELKYLERYAKRFNETIDTWLTNCFIIHIYYILEYMELYNNLGVKVDSILSGKQGYLDRAPLLISRYSIDDSTSCIFKNLTLNDKRIYSEATTIDTFDNHGYTTATLARDKSRGYFR